MMTDMSGFFDSGTYLYSLVMRPFLSHFITNLYVNVDEFQIFDLIFYNDVIRGNVYEFPIFYLIFFIYDI